MTIVTLVSGCGYAYPGDGTRDGGGQGGSGCRRTGSCGWATRTIRSGRAARRRCRSGSRPAKVVIRLEREGALRRRGYEVGIAPPQALMAGMVAYPRVQPGATVGRTAALTRRSSGVRP
jgi:hypothetical protein